MLPYDIGTCHWAQVALTYHVSRLPAVAYSVRVRGQDDFVAVPGKKQGYEELMPSSPLPIKALKPALQSMLLGEHAKLTALPECEALHSCHRLPYLCTCRTKESAVWSITQSTYNPAHIVSSMFLTWT